MTIEDPIGFTLIVEQMYEGDWEAEVLGSAYPLAWQADSLATLLAAVATEMAT